MHVRARHAGEENYPNLNAAAADVDPNFVAYQSYDGVSLVPGATLSSRTRAASSFTMPAPPSCALDAHGYCVATDIVTYSSVPAEACTNGSDAPIVGKKTTTYQILNAKGVLEPYQDWVYNEFGCPGAGWHPSNPATSLNDSSLP